MFWLYSFPFPNSSQVLPNFHVLILKRKKSKSTNKNETKPWIPVCFRDYSMFGACLGL